MRSNRPPFETFKKPWRRKSDAFGSACGHCQRCCRERGQMQVASPKLAPTAFEQFASKRGHDITPAVLPAPDRVYADRQTQELFETWNAGAQPSPRRSLKPPSSHRRRASLSRIGERRMTGSKPLVVALADIDQYDFIVRNAETGSRLESAARFI
jgi:hypothetical protein